MILKYVLKNFTRRKVRTILMILSLLVSTGLIVTMSATVETIRQSNVDLVASGTGEADITIAKKDISRQLFLPVAETAVVIRAADPRVTAVNPRLQLPVEMQGPGGVENVWLVGLDSGVDDLGSVEVLEGTYRLGDGRVAVLEFTAENNGLAVGDVINVAYAVTSPRRPGQETAGGASQSRIQRSFTVGAIVRQNGVTRQLSGMLVELSDVQAWLNLPGQASELAIAVDANLYATNNPETAALQVRSVAEAVQSQLGDDYEFRLDKPAVLAEAAQVFLAIQALINTFGLISLGVVGLLVYTLVMTNVQEQRRDMAVLRILGSQRYVLFGLVLVEVVVVGLIGVGFGVLLGQALTTYLLVPLLTNFLAQEGLTLQLEPRLSAAVVLPPVISAFVVLVLSSLKPAHEASRTKVMHAINPGVADNIQIEDLTQLRQRRPNFRMFFTGLTLVLIFGLITSFDLVGQFGGIGAEVVFALLGLFGLVLGLSLLFFITTIPFERLVLLIMGILFPRITYFARRNVSRGLALNTLISLLVLFSAVLPSFLGTNVRLELANAATGSRLRYGAPIQIRAAESVALNAFTEDIETTPFALIKPDLVENELTAVAGIADLVGVSYPYATMARDTVGMREAPVEVIGVGGDLRRVLYADLVNFVAGDPAALQTVMADPQTVIISEGLAAYLAVELGDVVDLQGAGLDNRSPARVVGIARRLPGFPSIGRSRLAAQNGSSVLVGMSHFRRLVTELDRTPPERDTPILQRVFATLTPDGNGSAVADEIRERYGEVHNFWTDSVDADLAENESETRFFTTFLLALTAISFATAVFAVFAVVYISIYARRVEIGMLKSMGMLRRELNGMLIVEAIAMTLGSALAGITAGAGMGYVTFYITATLEQRPARFAFDPIVIPAIIIMVVVASMLGAALSARRIVSKPAVEILRM